MKFTVLRQYLVPQHAYTRWMGCLGDCKTPWLKNWAIRTFINKYNVDMSLAVQEDYQSYATFNDFFIRRLKPHLRPIVSTANEIACPSDGVISQMGKINNETIFQAKGYDYSLKSLLGGSESLTESFRDGSFATIYLAPKDYHRVHMPFAGKLRETIYIPGSLFSVNKDTTEAIPNLFTRNERLVCIFDTDIGPMALILVGAMIVGNIVTSWQENPRTSNIELKMYQDVSLEKGAEAGYFKLGSTVIVLFGENKVTWNPALQAQSKVCMGQLLGVSD